MDFSIGAQNAITPIVVNGKVAGNVGAQQQADGAGGVPFKSLFEDAVLNFQETDAVSQADAYNLAIGDMDDLAALSTNSLRAETALQLMIELRNKVLDAYSELLRINM